MQNYPVEESRGPRKWQWHESASPTDRMEQNPCASLHWAVLWGRNKLSKCQVTEMWRLFVTAISTLWLMQFLSTFIWFFVPPGQGLFIWLCNSSTSTMSGYIVGIAQSMNGYEWADTWAWSKSIKVRMAGKVAGGKCSTQETQHVLQRQRDWGEHMQFSAVQIVHDLRVRWLGWG